MKNLLVLFLCSAFCFACTSKQVDDSSRKVASLDNNTETLLDPALESSADLAGENAKFEQVAATIGQFVARQSQNRGKQAEAKTKSDKTKGIEADLPQVQQDGSPIPEDIKKKYATRDVHRKTDGCYAASFEVNPRIQEELDTQIATFVNERKSENSPGSVPERITNLNQLGIFQPGTRYDAIVRFSNGHPGYRHDREPDARGMAMKLLPSGTVSKSVHQLGADSLNQATVLDILTINFPTFFVNDPVAYLKVNELFLKGSEDFRNALTGKGLQAGSVFFSGMTELERKLALLSNGSIIYSPLFQKYFSMVPSRLGYQGEARAVKYAFFPEACEGQGPAFAEDQKQQYPEWSQRRDFGLISRTYWAGAKTPPFKENWSHDYLREHTKQRLQKDQVCFALMFQLYRDQKSTNIEDSTDIWLENVADREAWDKMLHLGSNLRRKYYASVKEKKFSPYIKVASLKINKIEDSYPAKNTKTCEDLSFNPWNGRIDMHKPLGVVSRMKRRVYNASRRTRHTINELPTQSWER